MDRDQKGYIEVSDVHRLGSEVENIDNEQQQEEISIDGANAMIETTNHIFAAGVATGNNKYNNNQQRLESSVFQKLFAPPSP